MMAGGDPPKEGVQQFVPPLDGQRIVRTILPPKARLLRPPERGFIPALQHVTPRLDDHGPPERLPPGGDGAPAPSTRGSQRARAPRSRHQPAGLRPDCTDRAHPDRAADRRVAGHDGINGRAGHRADDGIGRGAHHLNRVRPHPDRVRTIDGVGPSADRIADLEVDRSASAVYPVKDGHLDSARFASRALDASGRFVRQSRGRASRRDAHDEEPERVEGLRAGHDPPRLGEGHRAPRVVKAIWTYSELV
jgi:hypothetical protein